MAFTNPPPAPALSYRHIDHARIACQGDGTALLDPTLAEERGAAGMLGQGMHPLLSFADIPDTAVSSGLVTFSVARRL
jgi:hypothetical protein